QTELALGGARHAGPGAAGAAVIAAEHARQIAAAQRLGNRRGEQAAELAHRELPAPFGERRRKDRPGAHRHPAAPQVLNHQPREYRRRFRTARLGTTESPGRADQFDLSWHLYVALEEPLQLRPNGR